jgi:hypothetical protein
MHSSRRVTCIKIYPMRTSPWDKDKAKAVSNCVCGRRNDNHSSEGTCKREGGFGGYLNRRSTQKGKFMQGGRLRRIASFELYERPEGTKFVLCASGEGECHPPAFLRSL